MPLMNPQIVSQFFQTRITATMRPARISSRPPVEMSMPIMAETVPAAIDSHDERAGRGDRGPQLGPHRPRHVQDVSLQGCDLAAEGVRLSRCRPVDLRHDLTLERALRCGL